MCVMVAVLKSDDIMTAVTTATDADSQPLQDLDANKPGVSYVLTVFLPSLFFSGSTGSGSDALETVFLCLVAPCLVNFSHLLTNPCSNTSIG